MLYALNLNSNVCQWFLNKAEKNSISIKDLNRKKKTTKALEEILKPSFIFLGRGYVRKTNSRNREGEEGTV